MKTYQTKQRKNLLSFLTENADNQFTIAQIADYMAMDSSAGKSTVYRLMQKLVDEGHVKRFVMGNNRHFLYQATTFTNCDSHLHLKCMACGKLFHLDENFSDELLEKIHKLNNFEIDENQTVLLGKCSDCNKLSNNEDRGGNFANE